MNSILAYGLTSAVLAYSGASVAQDKPGGYLVRPIRIVISGSPGAGGIVATEATAKAPADGYTLEVILGRRAGAGRIAQQARL